MQPNLGLSFSPLACVLVALGIGIAAAAIVRIFDHVRAGRQAPEAAPATPELGPESPALAHFLVTGARVGDEAFRATVLDLARLGIVEIVALEGCEAARVVNDDPRQLDPIQRAVLDRLRVAPDRSEGTTIDRLLDRWSRRAFGGVVMQQAQNRDLAEQRRFGDFWIVAPAVVLLATVFAALGGRNGQTALVALGALAIGWCITALSNRRRLGVLTPTGIEAAAHWLGVRAYVAADSELCAAPARSIAIWGPYFAYAVAFGVAHPTLRVLPPRVAPPPLKQPHLAETDGRKPQ